MAKRHMRSVHRETCRPQGSRSPQRQFSPVRSVEADDDGVNVPEVSTVSGDLVSWCRSVGVRSRGMYGREANLNSGGLCASSVRGRFNQLTEGELKSNQESDSSIVVRDGRADHMAKGWAEWIIEHSTQAEELSAPHSGLSRTLFNLNICSE